MINSRITQCVDRCACEQEHAPARPAPESVHRHRYPHYNLAAHPPAIRMVYTMTFPRIFSILFITAVIFCAPGTVLAQTEADVIAAVRAQIGANRQELVALNLNLTEQESGAFWPVYREFHNERGTLMDRRMTILQNFRDNFDGLTNEQSKQILEDYFSLQEDLLKLQKKYVKKFRKALSDKRTLRFFQIENKLDAIIEAELAQIVPLAE